MRHFIVLEIQDNVGHIKVFENTQEQDISTLDSYDYSVATHTDYLIEELKRIIAELPSEK